MQKQFLDCKFKNCKATRCQTDACCLPSWTWYGILRGQQIMGWAKIRSRIGCTTSQCKIVNSQRRSCLWKTASLSHTLYGSMCHSWFYQSTFHRWKRSPIQTSSPGRSLKSCLNGSRQKTFWSICTSWWRLDWYQKLTWPHWEVMWQRGRKHKSTTRDPRTSTW